MSAATPEWEMPDGVDRCPTCGRFVDLNGGFGDWPPGGEACASILASYCNEHCADSKPVPCIYEEDYDTPVEAQKRAEIEAARKAGSL